MYTHTYIYTDKVGSKYSILSVAYETERKEKEFIPLKVFWLMWFLVLWLKCLMFVAWKKREEEGLYEDRQGEHEHQASHRASAHSG
jgi:hypothetical protein